MATTTLVRGFVRDGLIVPNEPMPEGCEVEIKLLNEEEKLDAEFLEETKDWRRIGAASLAPFLAEHGGEGDAPW